MADRKENDVATERHTEKKAEVFGFPQNEIGISNKVLEADAAIGFAVEKELGPWEAAKAYPSAILWAFVMAACVIMEGYDTALLGSFFAYPSFQIKFGKSVGVTPSTPSGYQLTAAWQSGLSQAPNVGGFIGAIINGWLVTAFGQRRVVLWSLICMMAFIFIPFFAPNLVVLTIGEFLLGFPWATLATCAISYASEVLPPSIRTYLTSYTNMCFIIGQLIADGVLKGLSDHTSEWAYRIPFAIQWVWPCFLIPLVYLAPESPWYLVRVGRIEEAEKSLRRLQSSKAEIDPKHTLATIIHTNEFERENNIGTSYWDCIKGEELRRTEIACMAFTGAVLCGINFAYNSSYFFQSIGVSTSTTYSLSLGGVCLGLLSVGQLSWAYPAEIGSTRLRQKTICIARDVHGVVNIISGILQQYFMNPEAWDVKGYVGFVWGGTCFLMIIWSYFRLPETWNRPYEELDILFAQKTPARKFSATKVHPIEDITTAQVAKQEA
ncbi:sugar transporter domain-containing protein [Trichoderma sp. SZMC 28014]